jgi:hypothetical protein
MKMTTQLRLNSVVPHGVGSGSESLALDLIYEFLLHEFEQDIYRYISINQIGSELNEFVMKEPGNKIHVNIRYPAHEDFESKSVDEKNEIRLDVVHTALLRVAEYDKKLDIEQLEAIRKKIIANNFSFDFVCRSHVSKQAPNLTGMIIVHPAMDKFDYYVLIEEDKKPKCKLHIYNGRPGVHFTEFFFNGKWKGENEFIIWGKGKEVEIHILVDECRADFVNLTRYTNPPYFTVMRADVSEEDREKAYQDWKHSLPPAVAAITRQAHN